MTTAVEWLEEKLDNLLELYPSQNEELTKLIQEAKEMEKAEKEKFDNMLSMLEEAYRRLENTNMVSLRKEIKETINETFKLD
jgi:hypothetical protein